MRLNDRQLEAVKHGNFPLLILAGAGTGKTTTIINRIDYVVKNNSISPNKILALTFSVEATETLKKRLSNIKVIDFDLITVSTFHSLAKSIVEDNYLKLGYLSKPNIIEKDDLVYLFLKKINMFNYFSSKRYNRFPIKAIKSLLSIHDQFSQELFTKNQLDDIKKKCLDNISDSSGEDDEVYRQTYDAINTFEDFKKIKKESSLIEYEDMIYDFWQLINLDLDILSSLQKKFEFIIIDEFQDNNFAFSEIMNKIAFHQNITVVGDDDQSIYSFRGANSYNMHDFHNLYSRNPNYKKIELVKNYRSDQPILDIANSIIVNNDNRMEKELLVADSNNCKNEFVELYIGDYSSQLSQLTQSIHSILDQSNRKTIAVLCRTHSDCAFVAKFLNENDISHNYSNDKLFEQKTIKDVIAVLNIITPSKYSLHALIRLTRNQFPEKFIKNIIKIDSNSKNLLSACFNNKPLFRNIEYEWLSKIKVLYDPNISVNRLIAKIIKFVINGRDLSDFDSYSIKLFTQIVENFNGFYGKASIGSFGDYINLMLDNNSILIREDRLDNKSLINLMTVHNSKGMEFDYVFLPFLQSLKFPQANKNPEFLAALSINFKKWNNQEMDKKTYHIEEERRLFYVAITRAKEKLYLFTTPKRQSMFIKDIDKDLYISKEIEINLSIDKENDTCIETYESNDLDGMLHLSASKINSYNRCQLHYKYSNLDLIPYFKYNSLFVLGNTVHKVLQEFHENKMNTENEILRLLDKYWNKKLYVYDCESKQYYEDAKNMLLNYMSYLDQNTSSPILFEYYFKIKMKNYILSGVIDRLDIDKNGDLIIYDYKTSKTQKNISQIKNNFQLPIYALAVYCDGESMHKKIQNHFSPISAGELSLRFNDLERMVEFSESEIKAVDKDINKLAKEISSNVFKANPSFMNCAYCDYKKFICSHYN